MLVAGGSSQLRSDMDKLSDIPDYKLDPIAVNEACQKLLGIINQHEKYFTGITHQMGNIYDMLSTLIEELGLQKYSTREKLQEQLDGMRSYITSLGQEIHTHIDKSKPKSKYVKYL
ncbi:hypothetical protein LCGC14_2184100 [marine sediment metagenome]|uniref:Uncharacterized protein n=1 Tax=marine sediment metagenome TaxID=412755 RepID=A0A0F9DLI1_9ZZZZ